MGSAYPEIEAQSEYVSKMLRGGAFLHTLHQGMRELDILIAQHREDGTRRITGTEAFQLYDTFGFPIDLAEEVALEAGINLDREDFEAELEARRVKARETWKGSGKCRWRRCINACCNAPAPRSLPAMIPPRRPARWLPSLWMVGKSRRRMPGSASSSCSSARLSTAKLAGRSVT